MNEADSIGFGVAVEQQWIFARDIRDLSESAIQYT